MTELYSAVLRGLMVEPRQIVAVERRGIPRIEWLGIPLSLGRIWKQKIGVIAHQLDLSMKSRIISVSISPPIQESDANQCELGVMASILSLLLNISPQKAFLLGNITLDGKISAGKGLFPLRQATSLPILTGPLGQCVTSQTFSFARISDLIDWLKGSQFPECAIKPVRQHSLTTELQTFYSSLDPAHQLVLQLQSINQVGALYFDWPDKIFKVWLQLLQAITPFTQEREAYWIASLSGNVAEFGKITTLSIAELKKLLQSRELSPFIAQTYPGFLELQDFSFLLEREAFSLHRQLTEMRQTEFLPFPLKPSIHVRAKLCLCSKSSGQSCTCSRKEMEKYHHHLAMWQSICPLVLYQPVLNVQKKTNSILILKLKEQMKLLPSTTTLLESIAIMNNRKEPTKADRDLCKVLTMLPNGYS